MTPAACDAAMFSSRRNSLAQDHVLLSGLSIPLPVGLCRSMDYSELSVALTTPLLSGTASASGSLDSSGGDCPGTKSVSDIDRNGGPNRNLSEEQCGKAANAAEGHAYGCWKHQGHQQRHQVLGQPLLRPPPSSAEKEADAGEPGRTYSDTSDDKDTQKGIAKSIDSTVTTQVAPSINAAAGFTAADCMAVPLALAPNGRITREAPIRLAADLPSTAYLSRGSQGGFDLDLRGENAEMQSRGAHKPRTCRTSNHQETECEKTRELATDPGSASRRHSLNVALQAARCSRTQQAHLSSPGPETEIVTEDEGTCRETPKIAKRRAGKACNNRVPCNTAQMDCENKIEYLDRCSDQHNEYEQQQQHETSSFLSPKPDLTRGYSEMQRLENQQESAMTDESEDAKSQEGDKHNQQEHQQKHHHKQTDDGVNGLEGLGTRIAEEHGEMKEEGCGVLDGNSQESEEKTGEEDECDLGVLTPTSVKTGKLENGCDVSPGLQERKQLFLDELEHLQEKGYISEESTGNPSKRTSFEDAVESAVCNEKEGKNFSRLSQGLRWRNRVQEKKQEQSQESPLKQDGDELTEDELKKSVTAALAVAFKGKNGKEARNEKSVPFPFSPESCEASPEGFTISSFETAASSQSQSPLNLQKEEAAEGTRCGSTNNADVSSPCGVFSNDSHDSDIPAVIRLQHNKSASPAKSNVYSSSRNNSSLPSRTPFTHRSNLPSFSPAAPDKATPASTDDNNLDKSPSVADNGSLSHHSTTPWNSNHNNNHNNTAQGAGNSTSSSDRSGPCKSDGSLGTNATGCCDAAGTYDTCCVSGSSSNSSSNNNNNDNTSTSGVNSTPVNCQNDSMRDTNVSDNNTTSSGSTGAPGCTGPFPASSGVLLPYCHASTQGTVGSISSISRAGRNWRSATVGAAVMEDCLHSVRDLEENAARVLLVSPAPTGGAKKQQIVLPSLLLQNTPLAADESPFPECSLWGGKVDKLDTLAAARNADAFLASASSALGFYQSTLNEAAAAATVGGGIRKDDSTGMLLLPPPLPDGTIGLNIASAGHSLLLQQQQLTSTPFTPAGGQPLLGTGPILPNQLHMPTAVNTGAPVTTLDTHQALSQMWILQQRGGCLGASISTTAPSSIQLPHGLPTAFPPCPPPVATPTNLSALSSATRTPTASAVTAAALLPRSFRSRSDYLSLCSLQGCSTTQDNVRKPRGLEELRQLPSEEYISLPEMHLLAESLVSDFMKRQHRSLDSSTSSRGTTRVRRHGAAQKSTKESDCDNSATSNAVSAPPRSEPLVLHYRRDNLSFSVTPASSFTPYPSSVFEGAKKKSHQRSGCGSRMGLAGRDMMDEMEEEKKETLLGARCFTSADLQTNGSCPFTSSDRTGGSRRETTVRGNMRMNSAGDSGGRTSSARGGNNADEFIPPQATTHLFRARCQQAGTEAGISDSTIGAVDRAFAEAATSFFRETERQNNRCTAFCDSPGEASVDEYGGKQHRTPTGGKGTVEEPRSNSGKADVKAHSTRTGGYASRNCHRAVPATNNGADWRQGRVN